MVPIAEQVYAPPLYVVDVFDLVRVSPRLKDVKHHAIGDETELDKVASNPRLIWVQTQDDYGPADLVCDQLSIVNGQRVRMTSIAQTLAGVDVHLFTDYGPNGARAMEDLKRRLLLALRDVLEAYGRYRVMPARWWPRGAISQQSTEVIQPLRIFVDVWDTDPAQVVGATTAEIP